MILVFVGAGGSAAVNPEQYPTTVEFFNRLPNDIEQEPLFIQIREFLQSSKRGQPIDIEDVLWNLDELRGYFKASCDTNAIPGWIMANCINQLIGSSLPELPVLLNGMHQLKENQIRSLEDRINALVYGFYGRHPNDDELTDWVQLLEGLAERDPVIEIFTTNYDVVLELAIKSAPINVQIGRSSCGIQMRLDTTLWDTPGEPIESKYGRLTKLHGSVDWQHENGNIIVGSSIFTGDHQNHLILYPGYKDEPDIEPFRKFHEHLQAVVQKAELAIFVGFAFRDEYVNTILSNLPPEIPKFVINKEDQLPAVPFLTGCTHFSGGLTAESVAFCIYGICLHQGNDKHQSGDYQGAIADYDKAIQLGPQFADAYYNRGNARSALGDYQGAVADCDKAIQLDPRSADAYYNRGNARSALGDYEGAVADYDKAIEFNPQSADAYYNRGNARNALGDYEGAVADYDKAIQLDPQFADAYYNRGNAGNAFGDYQGAVADYDKAIQLRPQFADAYYNRGNARNALGDYQGAVADYDEVIQLDPRSADAYYNRGNARNALGDYQGAVADYDKAIQLRPQFAAAYYNRGNARNALGDTIGADEDFAKATELDPNL